MNHAPREVAVMESYPTFWDETPKPATPVRVAPEEAYSEFVNLTEDEFPSGEYRIEPPTETKATGN